MGRIVSVRGVEDSLEADIVLCCEHVFQDLTVSSLAGESLEDVALQGLAQVKASPTSLLRNLALENIDTAESELVQVVDTHRTILCEVSPQGRAPQPEKLVELSERLGLCIVRGTGWAPESAEDHKESEARMRRDLLESSIKAGFIGEIVVQDMADKRTQEVIQASIETQNYVRVVNKSRGPPIMFSLQEMHQIGRERENQSVVETFKRVMDAASSIAEQFKARHKAQDSEFLLGEPNILLFSGIFDALPPMHLGLDVVESAVREISEFLTAFSPFVSIIIGLPSPLLWHQVCFTLGRLCLQGFENRLSVSSGVRYKTDLSRYGGDGYAGVVNRFIPLVQETPGVTDKMLDKVLSRNALQSLSWYEEPQVEKPQKKPRWPCDGPCGKTYSAKKEPFTRMGFKYCSMDCMNQHRDMMDSGNKNQNDKGGGGGRRTQGGNTSWGIAVGT